MQRTGTAVLLTLAIVLGSPTDDTVAGPEVGKPYPPTRLPTLDGKTLDLRSLRGKKVLLIEFASW